MRRCNGVCNRYKAGQNWYSPGIQRCDTCGVFVKYTGLLCPCCKSRLRDKPRQLNKNVKRYDIDDQRY